MTDLEIRVTDLEDELRNVKLQMAVAEDVHESAIKELREALYETRREINLNNTYVNSKRTNKARRSNVQPLRRDDQTLPE